MGVQGWRGWSTLRAQASSPTFSRCRRRPHPHLTHPPGPGEALGGSPPLRWRGGMRRGWSGSGLGTGMAEACWRGPRHLPSQPALPTFS